LFFLDQVSFDLLEEYLEQHSEASSWAKGSPGFRENALFQDYHGLKSFRQVLPSFFFFKKKNHDNLQLCIPKQTYST
jgi:hypothetical protein